MRILQVVKTNRGAVWALNQAAHLKNLGVEMVTILPDGSAGTAAKYKELGMEVIAGDWRLPITKPWKFFSRCREINRVVQDVSPDLIHLHFVTNVLMCRLALYRDKTPRLFQVPGPLHLENKLTGFVERHTATSVDYWAGACKKTCDIYRKSGISADKVFLAYYGVPSKSQSQSNEYILHREFHIPDDKKIVAMVSYFYKPKRILGQKSGLKGHEDFIDAMKIVMETQDNVIPVVIGSAWDGAEEYEKKVRSYAQKRLGDRIIFTGYRDDIYRLYPEISVAVHPSHSENLGGAAESLMLAVPTISSDVGGFPDIVIPGETGCLAKAKNPTDLAEKITWAIEHNDELKAMAVRGQALVSSLLDLRNTSKQVFDVYSKILAGSPSL